MTEINVSQTYYVPVRIPGTPSGTVAGYTAAKALLDHSGQPIYAGSAQQAVMANIFANPDGSGPVTNSQAYLLVPANVTLSKLEAAGQILGAAGAGGGGLAGFGVELLAIATTVENAHLYGDDFADAGDGNDTIMGNTGSDSLTGGAGDDNLFGEIGNDQLSGGDGADYLDGGAGVDVLSGDNGNDVLFAGQGADTAEGGAGDDKYLFRAGDGQDTVLGERGSVFFGICDGITPYAKRKFLHFGVVGDCQGMSCYV